MKKTGLTLIAIALAFTTACGGGDSDKPAASARPTVSEISKSLTSASTGQTQALTRTQADCAAKLLNASALSDKALKALVAKSKTYKPTAADTKALTAVGTTITTQCA